MLKHLRKFVGWIEGDGIFAPGGSMSNMYGIVLARYHNFPEIKTKGLASVGQLVAFTSQEVTNFITKFQSNLKNEYNKLHFMVIGALFFGKSCSLDRPGYRKLD